MDKPAEAAVLAGEMFDHVRQREEIAPLAASPMLLTAMCIIYQEGRRLPQDKYDLYDRITDTVLCNRYPNDPAQVDVARNRLCVVAYGMHTGHGLDEDRATPQAETTHDEIERMIKRYRDESPGTEREFQGAVQVREELLTRSGLLLPREHDRGAFYHLTLQDFLAAQRLLDLVPDADLLATFRSRAGHPEWRSTLSFVFSSLLAKGASHDRGFRLLSAMIDGLAPDEPRLGVVAADCLEILWGRGSGLRTEQQERFRDYCLAAIAAAVPIKERFELGLALGRLGDPRVVTDLRRREAYVEIPAGKYRVGDNRKKDYYDWRKPLDEQTLDVTEPFLISRYPVTNAQYRVFLEEGGYNERRWWSEEGWRWKEQNKVREPEWWRDTRWNGPTQPVVGVSYWEAEAFAHWAGGRLPSEREWEAAARGPDAFLYPWGDQWENGICNSYEAGLRRTSPVGIFPRSRSKPFGLEDMAGNVWEWCSDLYSRGGESRMLRGGSWFNDLGNVRAAVRNRNHPENRNQNVGLRCWVSCRQHFAGGPRGRRGRSRLIHGSGGRAEVQVQIADRRRSVGFADRPAENRSRPAGTGRLRPNALAGLFPCHARAAAA